MLADIDILMGGSSSLSFTPNFPLKSEVRDYDVSSDFLSSKNSDLSCAPKNGRLDFATVLTSTSNSNSYLGSSAPTHFTFHGRCSSPTLKPTFSSTPAEFQKNFDRLKLTPAEYKAMPVVVPRRPCLVVRCNVLDLRTPSKSKKKVVFADDRGFPLTLVRTMTEPSNVPPQLSLRYLAKMAQDKTVKEVSEAWEVIFPQPASDYLDFRRRLDNNNVSLENVIVKEIDQVIVGTVKVRNLVFQKEVFMRKTFNSWKTQEDVYCTYVPNGPPSHCVSVFYDTFSFRFDLPSNSSEIEFCVCFRCAGAEYWDNNNGKNYFIVKKESPNRRISFPQPVSLEPNADGLINLCRKFNGNATNTESESWSESADLNHIYDNTPYW